MVELLFSLLGQGHKQPANSFSQRKPEPELSGHFERRFQVLDLIFNKAAGSEIPIDHPLAMKFQDSTLAKTAHDRFANFGRIGTARFRQCQALGHRADRHRYDALVDKLAELSSAVRTDVSQVPHGRENRVRIQ